MFRAVDLYQAASEDGKIVSCIERRQIRYRRDDHELVIAREPIRGRDLEPVHAIFLGPRVSWLPPHQNEPIDDSLRAAIARDIVEACKTFGIDTEVVGG